MAFERRAAAGDFLNRTEELVGLLPQITRELAAAKLAFSQTELSEVADLDDEAKIWQKNELGWHYVDRQTDESENSAFETESHKQDAELVAAFDEWSNQEFRQEWETKMSMGKALLKTWLTVDTVIEESNKIDERLVEEQKCLVQPRWRIDAQEEGARYIQNAKFFWKNDEELQAERAAQMAEIAQRKANYVYRNGEDHPKLEPQEVKKAVEMLGSRREKIGVWVADASRMLLNLPGYYEDPANVTKTTYRVLKWTEKMDPKVQRRRKHMLGIKDNNGGKDE